MLTDLSIRKLPAPPKGVAQHPDGRLQGFGLRVTASGVKSFYLTYRYKGRSRRLGLGRYPFKSLSDARADAHAALVALAKGMDPQAKQPRRKHTFGDALDAFIAEHCQAHNRASTAKQTERLLRGYFAPTWARRGVADLARDDVADVLEGITERGKPSAARHAFAAVRKFFNWAVEAGHIEVSPCVGMRPPAKHNNRDRVLNEDELRTIWRHTAEHEDTCHTVMRLLLLTAQRTGEVCGMRWDEIDFEQRVWTMAGTRTKNHKPHAVPLSACALDLLRKIPRTESPLVFPARGKPEQPYGGYAKPKAAIDAATGVTGWTLHDLRRTVATGLAARGTSPHVVEKILNHSTGTFGGVAGVYNRFQYMPEMRAALDDWADWLQIQCGS